MNNKRWIHYLELAIAVAGMTILYLILRDFQGGEPLFQDGRRKGEAGRRAATVA